MPQPFTAEGFVQPAREAVALYVAHREPVLRDAVMNVGAVMPQHNQMPLPGTIAVARSTNHNNVSDVSSTPQGVPTTADPGAMAKQEAISADVTLRQLYGN